MATWRGWLVVLALFGVPACGLNERQSVELLVLSDQLRVVDLRANTGATGVVRGDAHLLLDRWVAESSPISFVEHAAAGEVRANSAGLFLDDDLLHEIGDQVEAVVGSPELGARIAVRALGPAATCSDGAWAVRVRRGQAEGWVESVQRGGAVRGPSLWIQRQGSPPRTPRRLFALETAAGSLLWMEDGCTLWTLHVTAGSPTDAPTSEASAPPSDLQVQVDPWGQGTIRAPSIGVDLALRATAIHGQTTIYNHLTTPETWIAGAVTGRAARRTGLVEVTGQLGPSTPVRATGLFVEVGATAPPRTRTGG